MIVPPVPWPLPPLPPRLPPVPVLVPPVAPVPPDLVPPVPEFELEPALFEARPADAEPPVPVPPAVVPALPPLEAPELPECPASFDGLGGAFESSPQADASANRPAASHRPRGVATRPNRDEILVMKNSDPPRNQ